MEKQKKLFFSFLFFFFFITEGGIQVVHGSSHHHRFQHNRISSIGLSKLFVFGDSYADTGNNLKNESSWNMPYGITFPGKPAGRWSDGHILTDYIASFMKIKSPIPYRWRKFGKNALRFGMNFAHGGTGVFDTWQVGPNMTTQILSLQRLVHSGVYNKSDLNNSIALVSVAGNDYTYYNLRNGSAQGLPAFITSLINQLAVDLKRVHELGVRKVVVTTLSPLGCSPRAAASPKKCNETVDASVKFHNNLLGQAVTKLNNHTNGSPFVVLNLYDAFTSAYKTQSARPGGLKFENPFKACCNGVGNGFSCGSLDANGVKKYTVCSDRKSTFYWDEVHPAEQGWHAVYKALQPSLRHLFGIS